MITFEMLELGDRFEHAGRIFTKLSWTCARLHNAHEKGLKEKGFGYKGSSHLDCIGLTDVKFIPAPAQEGNVA